MLCRKTVALVCSWLLVTGLLFAVFSSLRSTASSHAPESANQNPQASPQAATLIINEYLADPPGSAAGDLIGDANGDGTRDATQDEFVEIVNNGAAPLDISGFTISDATQVRFTIPAGKIIPPGEAAVVFGGGTPTGAFGNAAANGLVFAVGGSGLSLNNGGDTITVKDNASVTADSVTFGAAEGGADQSITRSPDITGGFVPHSTASGSGGTLFSPGKKVTGSPFTTTNPVIDSISPDSAVIGSGTVTITVMGSNYQALSQVRVDGSAINTTFGSANQLTADVPSSVTNITGAHPVTVENPGGIISNSVNFTVVNAIRINEYLADPPGSAAGDLQGDANGDGTRDATQDEFVEIVNAGSTPVNIGGFTISDATQVRFTIPAGKIIPPGEAAVVFGGGTPTGAFGNAAANGLVFAVGGSGLSLNNGGDTITVKDNASVTADSVTFGAAEGGADQSITRSPDITGGFVPHSTAPGSGGSLFSPGARVNGSPFTTPAPIINSISPDTAVVGSGAVMIIVIGSNYQAASQVRVDGSPINTTFNAPTKLTAEIPASVINVTGAHPVTVENPGPLVSNAVNLTVVGAIRINEYLADPPGSAAGDLQGDANGDGTRDSADDEFVEIINAGSTPVNIGGFTISDATQVRFTVPAGKIIPPGEAAVVFGGGTPTGAFGNAAANGLVFAVGGGGLSLNNGGDTITVKDNASVTADSVTYGPAEGGADQSITRSPDQTGNFVPHSTATGSGGRLFSPGARVNGSPFTTPAPIINSISPDAAVVGSGAVTITVMGSNYEAASQVRVDGSPVSTTFNSASELTADIPPSVTNVVGPHEIRVENPGPLLSNTMPFTVISAIGINEFLADPPDGIAGDANGDGTRDSADDEFVEILNRTGAPVNVGGFTVSDADSVRFTFPPGTSIPAGEAAVIFGGGTPTGEFGNAGPNGLVFKATLSLNNSGDTITIKDGTNIVVETVTFGATEGGANQSANRNPDGSGTSFALHSTIPGSAGRLFSPGARVNGSPFTTGPRIVQLTPDSAPLNTAPFDMSVQGSGFEATSSVFIDSVLADSSFVSPGELIVQVPASVITVAGNHQVQVRNEGGNRSNVVILFIVPPPPILSSLIPRVVPVGVGNFNLFVMGENFTPSSVVVVEGSTVTTTFSNPHELKATVPASFAAATGTRRVKVRNSDGKESQETILEVSPASTRITTLSPAQMIAGEADFTLIVRGANFKSGATVIFNSAQLATKFISTTELQATVHASLIAVPGARAVTAQNADGGSSNEAVFQVLPNSPLIRSIDPPTIIEGAGETMIAIIGERFQNGAIARVIENGQPGARLDTKFINSARLEAKLPARFAQTAGNVSIKVENPDFGSSNNGTLKVLIKDPLVINEFLADPPDGDIGDVNGDGSRSAAQDEFVEIVNRTGESIDLSGYKLSDADEVRHVFAAGTVLPPFEATVIFGGGKPTGAFGNAAENNLVFKASTGGLSLNNGGDTIKLEDAQGRIIQQIIFNAAQGGANQSINRNPDAAGAELSLHTIVAEDNRRLFSPGAKATGAPFTTKPAIGTFAPASVRAGGPEFTLAITGSNFLPGAVVLFGQTELAAVFRSDTLLEAPVSAGLIAEGGAIEVRVRNPKGELSSSVKFAISEDPPRALKVTPPVTGTGAENLELTIEGERFQPGAKVMIGSEAIETRFISKTSLAAVAPEKFFKAAGSLQLQVINSDGNQSNNLTLAVENGPLITRLSRKRIKVGAGAVEMTIGGVAFKHDVVLFVNDRSAQTTFVSETSFTARIPAEMTNTRGNLILQARHADGGRSNKATLKVVE